MLHFNEYRSSTNNLIHKFKYNITTTLMMMMMMMMMTNKYIDNINIIYIAILVHCYHNILVVILVVVLVSGRFTWWAMSSTSRLWRWLTRRTMSSTSSSTSRYTWRAISTSRIRSRFTWRTMSKRSRLTRRTMSTFNRFTCWITIHLSYWSWCFSSRLTSRFLWWSPFRWSFTINSGRSLYWTTSSSII